MQVSMFMRVDSIVFPSIQFTQRRFAHLHIEVLLKNIHLQVKWKVKIAAGDSIGEMILFSAPKKTFCLQNISEPNLQFTKTEIQIGLLSIFKKYIKVVQRSFVETIIGLRRSRKKFPLFFRKEDDKTASLC